MHENLQRSIYAIRIGHIDLKLHRAEIRSAILCRYTAKKVNKMSQSVEVNKLNLDKQ